MLSFWEAKWGCAFLLPLWEGNCSRSGSSSGTGLVNLGSPHGDLHGCCDLALRGSQKNFSVCARELFFESNDIAVTVLAVQR